MKKVLIVVDYQEDFVNRALGFDGAEKLDDGIAELVKQYHDNGDIVVFTYDTHHENYLETTEGKRLPVEHCIQGTNGFELYGKTGELAKEYGVPADTESTRVVKKAYDSNVYYVCKPTFGSIELGRFLEYMKLKHSVNNITLVGLVTNICVLSNAVIAKAACPEAEIKVPGNMVASFDKVLHEKTLEVLNSIHIDTYDI